MMSTKYEDDSAQSFNIVEATIEDHRRALASGALTAVELATKYLLRISTYDTKGPALNSIVLINPAVLIEARASDERRRAGLTIRPLEGIPYTLKDSFKYKGLTVSSGSPAFEGLLSHEDSFLAAKLKEAGAVLLGKTNMPPMAAGGMQRGLYGRALSPYNAEYLAAAFASGSSNGAATSTAASFAAFGLGSETVSSGRSPASNNGLVAYTPSRGILSCRGLWPLYGTCDVPVPYTRTMADMLEILDVLCQPDSKVAGDFWREQPYVKLPAITKPSYTSLAVTSSLDGKRIGVPRMYINESSPATSAPITTSSSIMALWQLAKADLELLGAIIIPTDFPLVTSYEDSSISGQANNVVGAPSNWNAMERSTIIAKAWDDFLIQNADPRFPSLGAADPQKLFPKPKDYVPDTFMEAKNAIDYSGLITLAQNQDPDTTIYNLPGMSEALPALEAQRKRDLEDWMDTEKLDLIIFPANADVGKADLETNPESAEFALRNGVRYSNGNRALRNLGVPTVSVTMGITEDKRMPCNLTFAGKAYQDDILLQCAYAFEQIRARRIPPPLTPTLSSDKVKPRRHVEASGTDQAKNMVKVSIDTHSKELSPSGKWQVKIGGTLSIRCANGLPDIKVYIDGEPVLAVTVEDQNLVGLKSNLVVEAEKWEVRAECDAKTYERLTEYEKPMLESGIMALAMVRSGEVFDAAFVMV